MEIFLHGCFLCIINSCLVHNYSMRKDVSVKALMKSTGEVVPLAILWEDGREIEIDRILDARPRASLKGGGMGVRYKVRVKNQERFLFLDGFIWFVEID